MNNKVPDKLIKEWKNHIKWLGETLVEPEDPILKTNRIQRALTDYDYFVETYFKHYVTYNGNVIKNGYFHREVAYQILETDKLYLAAKWSRGHGKSTHMSLFIPIWLMLNRKINHILLVSKTRDDSVKLLQHIQGEFEYNTQLINDFSLGGTFITEGDWTKQTLVVNGYNTCFNITGRGQDPRGLRYKNYRVDYIIIDDLDDKELVMNTKRVNELWDWVKESLLQTVDIKKFRVVFVENLYSNNSLMFKFITEIKDIYLSTVNAMKEDGTPTWTERFTKEDFEFIKQNMGTISWLREYQNTPITTGSIFKQEWIQFGDITLNNNMFVVIYFDPSWKSSSKSDYKSVQILTKYNDKFFLLDTFTRQCSINTAIGWIYDQYDKYNNQGIVPYLYMESNFAQELLWTEIQTVTKERGYQLPVLFDDRQKGNKFARIESMSSYFERGMIVIKNDLEKNPDCKRLLDQLLGFEQGSSMHDDSLDALESGIYFVNRNTRNFNNNPIIEYNEENIKY